MTTTPADVVIDDAVLDALTRMIVRKVLADLGLRAAITRTIRGGGGGGGSTTPDATATVKGKLRLAGDLAGTALLPLVEAIQGVVITGTPALNDILTATGPTAAHWAPPPTVPDPYVYIVDSDGITIVDTDGAFLYEPE